MRPPFSYYGGKQNMLKHILPLIPEHKIYVEPFVGGGALLFKKAPSDFEVINDVNDHLVIFYRTMKLRFPELQKLIDATLHSETIYQETKEILQQAHNHDDPTIAWAVWVQCNMSFGAIMGGGFAFEKRTHKTSQAIINKRDRFHEYETRLSGKRITIFNRDFENVIRRHDFEDTFIFEDPPYINSDCGHYSGLFDEGDLKRLLKFNSKAKAKWLMSSYPHPMIEDYVQEYGWYQREYKKLLSVDGKRKEPKYKIEVLTANYKIDG